MTAVLARRRTRKLCQGGIWPDWVQVRKDAGDFLKKTAPKEQRGAVLDFVGSLRITQNFTADGDLLLRAATGVKEVVRGRIFARRSPGNGVRGEESGSIWGLISFTVGSPGLRG